METPDIITPGDEWVSLKDAVRIVGVKLGTLRSWYQKGEIQSKLEPGPQGPERRVLLSEVEARHRPRGHVSKDTSTEPESVALQPLFDALKDMAGQLAEKSADAARYETEAKFLREQLAELRAELEDARAPAVSTNVDTDPGLSTTVDKAPVRRWWQRSQ